MCTDEIISCFTGQVAESFTCTFVGNSEFLSTTVRKPWIILCRRFTRLSGHETSSAFFWKRFLWLSEKHRWFRIVRCYVGSEVSSFEHRFISSHIEYSPLVKPLYGRIREKKERRHHRLRIDASQEVGYQHVVPAYCCCHDQNVNNHGRER